LYLPHFAVHTPIQGPPALVEKYRAKLRPEFRQQNAQYAAMVESLDTAVGRVLQTLEQLDLSKRTIVIFTSDNGGRITQATTSNSPLRFGKGSAYEGGVRVPLIVRWPGVIEPGRESDQPVITMDLLPTLAEACGLDLKAAPGSSTGPAGRDGVSLVPLLKGRAKLERSELCWHYPHHQHYQLGGAMPYGAIRSGNFKLIEFFNDMHVELYDLSSDLGEQHDLAEADAARAAQLRERLHRWREEVGAQMPTTNPHYDPSRPEYNPPPKPKRSKR
jgi:arylsulfatase A-like enzyme